MGELASVDAATSCTSTSRGGIHPTASQRAVAASAAAADESTASDKSAASDEGSASNKGAATDEGTAHETIISHRRPERLHSAASSGPMATSTSGIIKAYPLP